MSASSFCIRLALVVRDRLFSFRLAVILGSAVASMPDDEEPPPLPDTAAERAPRLVDAI